MKRKSLFIVYQNGEAKDEQFLSVFFFRLKLSEVLSQIWLQWARQGSDQKESKK